MFVFLMAEIAWALPRRNRVTCQRLILRVQSCLLITTSSQLFCAQTSLMPSIAVQSLWPLCSRHFYTLMCFFFLSSTPKHLPHLSLLIYFHPQSFPASLFKSGFLPPLTLGQAVLSVFLQIFILPYFVALNSLKRRVLA